MITKITIISLILMGFLHADSQKSVSFLKLGKIPALENDKVLVDCRYEIEKGIFFDEKKYSFSQKEDFFLEDLCIQVGSEKIVTTLKEIRKVAQNHRDYVEVESYYSPKEYDIYYLSDESEEVVSIEDQLLKNGRENLLSLGINLLYKNEIIERGLMKFRKMSVPLVELSEPREFKVKEFERISIDTSNQHKATHTVSLNRYKTEDYKSISDIDVEGNIKIKNERYTNTYDINEIKECIDGKVWIKKYGSLSGAECGWKREKEAP